jgi:hypothetical protein
MSYKIMPPGSHNFWRIGLMSPLVRWFLTASACLALALSWYLISTRFLFKNETNKLWCSQCAAQLAELATADDTTLSAEIASMQPSQQCSLDLLQLCEQHHLTVVSCTCQKPTTKNNLTLQRVNLSVSGTLTHFSAFLTALGTSAVLVANLEAHLMHQQHKLYSCILSIDCIVKI